VSADGPTAQVSGGVVPAGGLPGPPGWATSGRVLSFEQAQAVLAAKGAHWQRLETAAETGEWRFECSVPNRSNPSISRTYTARDRNYLVALQMVIDQISRDQASPPAAALPPAAPPR
jgi:hypothetical protein